MDSSSVDKSAFTGLDLFDGSPPFCEFEEKSYVVVAKPYKGGISFVERVL